LHVEPGAVSALIAENTPILLDVKVLRNRLILMSAGTHTESVSMSPGDLHGLTKAILTSILE
jgi:prolyl-tRNA editing enzyme YbaK/EbsC (Cys-tRNA(Pro) deacylase)